MNLRRSIYLTLLICGFSVQFIHAQEFTQIDGVINDYTRVTSILCADAASNNTDSVVVSSVTGFEVGDTVMLYVVKGMKSITTGPNDEHGDDLKTNPNTGKYALVIIMEITGNMVVFNTNLNSESAAPEFSALKPGEMAQLIRVRAFRHAEVSANDSVKAEPWNPVTGTGGVVAMFVHGTLRLNGNITASEAGFRGAPGNSDSFYNGDCSSTNITLYDSTFYQYGNVLAGLKGEGVSDTTFANEYVAGYIRGKAKNINGGGGGNARFAGGGGGSNYSAGTSGGDEDSSCGPGADTTGGQAGYALRQVNSRYYINEDDATPITLLNRHNRVFFGGGGGSGTRMNGISTSDGGNGGGIVLIFADSIEGNNNWIRADGANVSDIAAGAGGGGGAGGCIILDVSGYKANLQLSALGGSGGAVESTTGYGGAGGGGIYWLSGNTHDNVDPEVLFRADNGDGSEQGSRAGKKSDYIGPLRGFLFNPVPSGFTICSDQVPDPIYASEPRGGVGGYTYEWVDSTSSHDWQAVSPATVVNNSAQSLVFTMEVTDTTYFKRIVHSGALHDTSYIIPVYVHTAIEYNTISAPDTVCIGDAPELLGPSQTSGGPPHISGGGWNSSFTYIWQQMDEGAGTYTNVTGITEDSTYQAPGLNNTADFRRIARAGVCVDTSTALRVQVLPIIDHSTNVISSKDTICIYGTPDQMVNDAILSGGDGTYSYVWQQRLHDQVDWINVPGDTASANYQPGSLADTTFYRRLVYSGNGRACMDVSESLEILVLPDIANNQILSADETVCQMDIANTLTATTTPVLGGGDRINYIYTWLSSTDQVSWVPDLGGGPNNVPDDFEPGIMSGTTTWYRRLVESGGVELVCKDTSLSLQITVLDSITNNRISTTDDRYCQGEMTALLSGLETGGEMSNRSYHWFRVEGNAAPGADELGTELASGGGVQNFTDTEELLTDADRWYRRVVISGPAEECNDTSKILHLVVHKAISSNTMDDRQAICIGDIKDLRADPPGGGENSAEGGESNVDTTYLWRNWNLDLAQTPDDAVDIPLSNHLQFSAGPLDGSVSRIGFNRVVNIGECWDTSAPLHVTVMQLPDGQLVPHPDFEACSEYTVGLGITLGLSAAGPGHAVAPSDTTWSVFLTMEVLDPPRSESGIGPFDLTMADTGNPSDSIRGVLVNSGENIYEQQTFGIDSIYYLAEAEYNYKCFAPLDASDNTVEINVYRTPSPLITKDSTEVCRDWLILEVEADDGEGSWEFTADHLYYTTITENSQYRVYIDTEAAGAYTGILDIPDVFEDPDTAFFLSTAKTSGCIGRDTIPLRFFEQPAQAHVRKDTVLFLIDSVRLRADPATAGYGMWTVTKGIGRIIDIYSPNTRVEEMDVGENEFEWTVMNGEGKGVCGDSDTVSIVHRALVKRYEGFSPNGDLFNEYFIMQGLNETHVEFSLTFFNGIGKPVRTMTDQNLIDLEIDETLINPGLAIDEMVVWDGRNESGNLVPSGTYYYVLTYKYKDVPYDFTDIVVVVRD